MHLLPSVLLEVSNNAIVKYMYMHREPSFTFHLAIDSAVITINLVQQSIIVTESRVCVTPKQLPQWGCYLHTAYWSNYWFPARKFTCAYIQFLTALHSLLGQKLFRAFAPCIVLLCSPSPLIPLLPIYPCTTLLPLVPHLLVKRKAQRLKVMKMQDENSQPGTL